MLAMWENSIKRLHEVSEEKALDELKTSPPEQAEPGAATLELPSEAAEANL